MEGDMGFDRDGLAWGSKVVQFQHLSRFRYRGVGKMRARTNGRDFWHGFFFGYLGDTNCSQATNWKLMSNRTPLGRKLCLLRSPRKEVVLVPTWRCDPSIYN